MKAGNRQADMFAHAVAVAAIGNVPDVRSIAEILSPPRPAAAASRPSSIPSADVMMFLACHPPIVEHQATKGWYAGMPSASAIVKTIDKSGNRLNLRIPYTVRGLQGIGG